MTSTATTFEKSISYDRESHDFCATLDGNYIGHFNSYHEAECALDQVAYDLLVDGQCATATELDAGSADEEIAADTLVMRADAPAQLAAVVQADALLSEADAVLGTCEIAGCGSVATHHLLMLDTPRIDRVCCVHHARIVHEPCRCATSPAPRCAGFVPGICASAADPATAPYCRACAAGIDKAVVAAYVQKLMEDAGLACQYCGEPHASDACPLRKPLVAPAPTTCKNCGQAHSIQNCPELWHSLRLFA